MSEPYVFKNPFVVCQQNGSLFVADHPLSQGIFFRHEDWDVEIQLTRKDEPPVRPIVKDVKGRKYVCVVGRWTNRGLVGMVVPIDELATY